MNKAHVNLLKEEFDRVCDEYLIAFCRKFDLPYDRDHWVGGYAGSIAEVGSYYFDFMDVIKYSIDNNIEDFNEIDDWNDYTIDASSFGLRVPSFKEWHNGCARLTQEQLDGLCEKKKELDELVAQYKENTVSF